AYLYPGPAAVRYQRGTELGVEIRQKTVEITIGKAEIVASFNGQYDEYISVLALGRRVQAAVEAADETAVKHGIGVRVVNMRFDKPLDTQMLDDLALSTSLFVTVEEHAVMGGAGSAVNEYLAEAQIVKPILNLGLDDTFMAQATHAQMLQQAG